MQHTLIPSDRRAQGVRSTLILLCLCALTGLAHAQGRYAPQGDAQRYFQVGERHLAEAAEAQAEGDDKETRDHWEEALEAFEEALSEDANYAAVYPKLGLIHYSLERSEDAIPVLRKGLERFPGNNEITFWLGNHLLTAGEHEEALGHLSAVAEGDDIPQVHLVLGNHHYNAGDYATARLHLERYVGLNPDDLTAQAKLGNAWFKLNRPRKALAAFEAVQRRDPDNLLVLINIGNAHYTLGDYPKAITLLEQAERRAPNRPSVVFNLAQSRFKLGKHAEALAGYDRFLTLKPKSFNGHYFRGSALMALDRDAEALGALRKAIELKPDVVHPHYKSGLLHMHAGRLAQATRSLNAARRLAPDDPWVLTALGTVARKQGRYEPGAALQQRAITLKPGAGRLHGNLALTRLAAGDVPGALAEAREALKLAPADAWVQGVTVSAMGAQAKASMEAGQLDEAAQLLAEALALRPDDKALKIDQSLLLSARGEGAKAQQLAAEALEALPEVSPIAPNALYALGVSLLAQGKAEAAVAPLQRATTAKASAAFTAATAGALLEARRHEDAAVLLEEAVKAWPEDKILKRYQGLVALGRAWGALQRGGVIRRGDVNLATTAPLTGALKAKARYLALIYHLRRGDAANARAHFNALESTRRTWDRGGKVLSPKAPDDHLDYLGAVLDAQGGRWSSVVKRLDGLKLRGGSRQLLQHAQLRLADRAWGRGEVKQATAWLKAAQKLGLTPLIRHNLAVATFKQGKERKAEKQWRALLDEIPEARFNLAVALDAQGRVEEAVPLYTRYGKGNGPGADRARARVEARQRIFGGPR